MLSVIIAEDDPAMRHVLKETLSKIPDVEVLGEASDGITALKLVEKLNPRVVFIDIDLPGKNGVELAREIGDINPQTILIFATAYDNHTHEAFEVYAYDYLVKPFKLDRIKKTMERKKATGGAKVVGSNKPLCSTCYRGNMPRQACC
ncbi:LytR/AlgR family response regulator transcription factor [Desulfoscipio geothermicus]|uniref:Stage 0 sporulation protein A homolog n=1 Tax=Desulfoscipio geothermicus DSM 3669 TaxID=1121426 RepID=A0A1I6DW52_9FIRM|nr:response regulator [Desulfoscipio geothermicus]SFR09734.1 Response regulator receiver domain-containing protein [Desulfoscipio geothermicus DSM 3669]